MIYSQFLNLGHEFMSKMEDSRKRELMQFKSSKKSLDVDGMPQPPRDQVVFIPPHKSREKILIQRDEQCRIQLQKNTRQHRST